ncbi:Glutathione transport system permease protein GsiD [bioreactor metagenome]|uniref:Glutathione transport system permease protein GsiD n=1 Tax=bioreactor metagenome TaxID=1076179 RepID=A0A645B576_9ZZZZ
MKTDREDNTKEDIIKNESRFQNMKQNKSIIIGSFILMVLIILAILAPYISPNDPNLTNSVLALKGPIEGYPFGTDEYGRCILSRMLYGARVTLPYSTFALGIAIMTGVPLGLVAGYYKKLDNPLMRFMDILMAFPGILLAIVIVATLGTGLLNVTVAVGIGTMPAYARLIRGSVLSLKEQPFVEASIAAGARDSRIIIKHILPNCVPTIVVYSMLEMAWVIMSISTLSFLGIGAQPPTPEWGALVSAGKNYILSAPHISTFPVIFIFATVMGFNLIGDGLRDVLDPRM